LFITALVHIVDGVKSKPQIPKGTKFVSLHEGLLEQKMKHMMPKKVNKVFASQPLDLRGGDLNRPGPLGYFGLLMVNLSRPPLPPNLIVGHLTIMNMLRI
jgi:hypothetical protein